MTVSTHRAGPADLEALVPLFDAYRQFHDQPSDLERAREWLIPASPQSYKFVAKALLRRKAGQES